MYSYVVHTSASLCMHSKTYNDITARIDLFDYTLIVMIRLHLSRLAPPLGDRQTTT